MIDQSQRASHPVLAAAARSPRLFGLLDDVVPEYKTAAAIADHTAARTRTTARAVVAQSQWPTDPSQVDGWLTAEVERRRGASEQAITLEVLNELEVDARRRVINLIEEHAPALVRALGEQLEDLLTSVQAAVDAMGPTVATAADAIDSGCANQWKAVSDLVAVYDDIRSVQRTLYRCTSMEFDALRCGDGVPGNDPSARLYFLKNLDQVAPRWRGWRDDAKIDRPPELPWPTDDVGRLVWIVRHDAGAWCPTATEITKLLAEIRSAHVPPPRGRLEARTESSTFGERKTEPAPSRPLISVSAWDTPASARK